MHVCLIVTGLPLDNHSSGYQDGPTSQRSPVPGKGRRQKPGCLVFFSICTLSLHDRVDLSGLLYCQNLVKGTSEAIVGVTSHKSLMKKIRGLQHCCKVWELRGPNPHWSSLLIALKYSKLKCHYDCLESIGS